MKILLTLCMFLSVVSATHADDTDKNGIALPENQLIVKSGDSNKQVQMSIDEFSKLNREQIYSMFT